MSALVSTKMGPIGDLASRAITEMLDRATAGSSIATYAEGESPLRWDVLVDGGWDLVGVQEDTELRDLVGLAQAWGSRSLPLPYLETVICKRHSEAARTWNGPVTFAVPTASQGPGSRRYVPFGQVEGILMATSLGGSRIDELVAAPSGNLCGLDIVSRGMEIDGISTMLSSEVAREIAVIYAASSVGAARRLLELGIEFAKERRQFGKPIGSFQAVKHHLANALIAVESADAAVLRASSIDDIRGGSARYSANRCLDAAELVLQVHGGIGFTWEMGLHFYLRHIIMAKDIISGLLSWSQASARATGDNLRSS